MSGVDTQVKTAHKKIRVRHRDGTPKRRVVHMLGGYGPETLYGVHNSSLDNLVRGVTDRVFTVDYKDGSGPQTPIRPSFLGFMKSVEPAHRYLRRNKVALRRWTEDKFISSYDTAQLRSRYDQARASLKVKPLTRADARVKTFVKAEKVNFTAKADPAPRIISPRDPRYNLTLGRYIKPIEGYLYKMLNDMCGGRTVMKGLNSIDTASAIRQAWDEFEDPVAVGLDAKRFDQHTHTAALTFERLVYLLFFHGVEREELAELLSWQKESECRGYTPEGFVKFVMKIRASGDMNTGLGTCLIACSLLYSYLQSRDINWRLINNGDDCLIIVNRRDLRHLDGLFKYCKRAGYWMEIEEPVDDFEKIVFCQCQPVETGAGWRMVRQFPHSLGKDLVSVLPLTTKRAWGKWATDVGNCGVALNAGVPILQAYYSNIRRQGDGSFGDHPYLARSGLHYQSRGMSREEAVITEGARFSFWKAFGVSPYEQMAIEADLNGHPINLEPGRMGKYKIDTLQERKHTYYSATLNITENYKN